MFKQISDVVNSAKDRIFDETEKIKLVARLRNIIDNEKQVSDKAYIALGKYYYNNLRENSDSEVVLNCKIIDEAEKRINEARMHLAKIYAEKDNEENLDSKESVNEECEIEKTDENEYINESTIEE